MTEKEAWDGYDSSLNETLCEGNNLKLGSFVFEPARALRKLDPIAYRCGFNDWCDFEEIDTDELT